MPRAGATHSLPTNGSAGAADHLPPGRHRPRPGADRSIAARPRSMTVTVPAG
ncbi:MAG: hypothetical protein MZW92_57990 [Comamonadaceae bacterium]|nr:hypothetical protein [Comamonadaceae bacterium]